MSDVHDLVFRATELDPELLSTPYRCRTNWQVITGAASCGKTTLIDLLTARGFRTVPEVARQYMERELARGRTMEEIHDEVSPLNRGIVEMKLSVERALAPSDLVFLDCAVPGSMAWYRLFGMDPNEVLASCFEHRYASVFVLDPLPLRADSFRFEGDEQVQFVDEWLTRDYRALGYDVVRVPVLPPQDRLEFVLERVARD